MKTKFILAMLAISLVLTATADTQIEVSVSDGDFEMIDADISHLAVGESEILYTNGKEITLTRTDSGVEVLVDGEELGKDIAAIKSKCNVNINVDVQCDDCEEGMEETNVFVMKTSDMEDMQVKCFSNGSGTELHEDGQHKIIMISKRVEIVNEVD